MRELTYRGRTFRQYRVDLWRVVEWGTDHTGYVSVAACVRAIDSIDGSAHEPLEVVIERDVDGKWAARWPEAIVAAGMSAGAGRHEARRDLLAAIESAGFTIDGPRSRRTIRVVRP